MAIVCRKCKYEISKITITVYSIEAIAAFITTVLPYLRKTRNITEEDPIKYIKSMADDALTASANILKINCPTCNKYEYWDLIKDTQSIE